MRVDKPIFQVQGRVAKPLAQPAAVPPQALTQEVKLSSMSPQHFQANLGVRFGAAGSVEERLALLAQKDPSVQRLLKESQLNAARNGKTEVDLKHLLLVLFNMAENVASVPDVLTTQTEKLSPLKKFAKDSVDALLPKPGRGALSPGQIVDIVRTAKPALISMSNTVDANATPGPLALSDNLKSLWSGFLSQSPEGKQSVPEFAAYLRKTLPTMQGLPPEYVKLEKLLNGLQEKTKTAKVVVEDIKEPEEPKIPIYKRDTSNKGFATRVEELRQKGVMTDYQYEAIQNILHRGGSGGGDIFGGGMPRMDGGVTKERLKKYLYEFDWKQTKSIVDPERTRAILDRDHAYLEDVKRQIVDYQKRLVHLRERGQEPKHGKLICLVGPPGVGKTSIANSIAQATNQTFARLSLSNIEKPSDLVGHSSTFVNAQPGRLFKAMVEAGSINPVLVLDEVDKLKGDSMHGSVADTLLNILDKQQNDKVVDEYLGPEMPLDFSRTTFILTANHVERIPAPIRNRLHMIFLDGYDMQEKITIAQNHLIPRIRKELALSEEEFQVTDDTIRLLGTTYTMEAGVREMERNLEMLADGVIDRISSGQTPEVITPDQVKEILGPSKIFTPEPFFENVVGRVNGLAVAGEAGGALMSFEASMNPVANVHSEIPGRLRLSDKFPVGNFKKMTNESATHAFGWVDDHQKQLGISLPHGHDIEVKIAAERLSYEKDGDSAGAAFATAITSALTKKPIRHDVAMTGTITLHGRVLAIGGVKQKLRGALQANMKVVFLPKENEKDVENLPERMKDELNILSIEDFKQKVATNEHVVEGKMTVVPVSRIEDILEYALEDFAIQPVENAPDLTAQTPTPPVQFSGLNRAPLKRVI